MNPATRMQISKPRFYLTHHHWINDCAPQLTIAGPHQTSSASQAWTKSIPIYQIQASFYFCFPRNKDQPTGLILKTTPEERRESLDSTITNVKPNCLLEPILQSTPRKKHRADHTSHLLTWARVCLGFNSDHSLGWTDRGLWWRGTSKAHRS